MDQPSLFDVSAHAGIKHRESPAARPRPAADRVTFKRTALRRDCDQCMIDQHETYDPHGPLPFARQRADVQMFIRDARGEVAETRFLCTTHGEAQGWDASRSRGPGHKRQATAPEPPAPPEPSEAEKLASGLRVLAMQAKTGWIGATFGREAERLITQGGGKGLDFPEWESNPHADGLIGQFRTDAARQVKAWSEVFGTDIDTDTAVGETCIRTTCRLGAGDGTKVTVYGYAETIP